MTHFAKRCELEALVTEREKMRTHNDYCNAVQSCKDGPFHEQSEFDDLAARMRALAMEQKVVTLRRSDIDGAWVLECPGTFEIFDTRAQALKAAGEREWLVREEPATHDHNCSVGGCENSPDECDRCAAHVSTEGPCGCEESEELRKRLLETEDARDAATESLVDVARQRDEARKQYDEIRATLHSVSEELTKANVPACDTYARAVRCLVHERNACSRMAEKAEAELSTARAEVASLQALACTQRDCLGEANAEVERLKRELAVARDQLPAWAKRFMRVGIAGPISCHLADCPSPNCSAWRNLTPDQRRQCEEP
jgi:hypothetical protein